jgi:hypothetical protein
MKQTPATEIRVPFAELLDALGMGGVGLEVAEVGYFDRLAQEVVFHVRVKEGE